MLIRPARASRLVAGVLTVVVALAATVAASSPVGADHEVQPARIGGDTRFETAAEIARFDHSEGSGVAVLANGLGYADALAAAALARSTVAPVLLTNRDTLPAETASALEDLGVQEIVVLGGTKAVSAELEAQLAQQYERVVRFDGETRFHTAIRIAESVEQSPNASIGSIDGQRTAMVVSADAPADAVLAGSFAAGQDDPFPVLFTERHRLSPVTEQALVDLGIERVIVVGGSRVVHTTVDQRLGQMDLGPTRLGGVDRQETALLVAEHARSALGWDSDLVNLVRGDDFADALAAGPYAGRAGSPIVLTQNPTTLGARTSDWLARECPVLGAVRAIGGVGAVSVEAIEEAVQRAESCHAGEPEPGTGQTYIVTPQEVVSGAPGDRFAAEVSARYDGEAFTGPVNAAILPCEVADVVGAGGDTFQDADGDGVVDRLGTSDTGQAAIIDVNGQGVAPTGQLLDVGPDTGGTLEVGVTAQGDDCVVPVVYHDLDGDDAFAVQDDGRAGEPYGVGQFEWLTPTP